MPEYGDGTECADPNAGVKGECGIWSLRGVREDRGAGTANGDGGMVIRGDRGFERVVLPALLCEATLSFDVVDEEVFESNEVLRESAG